MHAASSGLPDLSGGCVVRDARRNGSCGQGPRQKKREIHYALDCRDGEVFLVRRARDAPLMAGMWELPELAVPGVGAGEQQVPRFARNDKIKKRNDKVERNDKIKKAVNDKTLESGKLSGMANLIRFCFR